KGGMPELHWTQWIGCLGAMVLGILLGNYLAPKIPDKFSRAFVIIVAFSGAITLMINGLTQALA
ncbi:MAG TPA: hypothetical protein DCY59_09785, partial [Micrococcaceae bacterium]|nr:hypothetical protein [Micrococcaceae bacterium]